MKKFGKLFVIAALAMVSYNASAELAPQWTKGTVIANAHVGFLSNYDNMIGADLSMDYVLFDDWWQGHFTVGGQLDFSGYNDHTNYGITPRATYGLNISDKFEVHAVATLGTVFRTWKWVEIENNAQKKHNEHELTWYESFMLGCRYFFTDNIGVTAEMGWADWMPDARIGLSFKF